MSFKVLYKNTKGITLIALVVTVIILLILVGISISMLTGENGILKKAIETKEKTEKATELEKLQLAITSALIDNQTSLNILDLKKHLDSNGLNSNKLKLDSSGFRYSGDTVDYKISMNGILKIFEKNQVDFNDVIIGNTISNYTCNKSGNKIIWKIFCYDDNNVYIAPSKNTEPGVLGLVNGTIVSKQENAYRYQGFPELETYKNTKFQIFNTSLIDSIKGKLNNCNNNAKAVEYLLDNTNWVDYTDDTFADWAIGGPTAEMIKLSLIQESSQSLLTIGEWENYGFNLSLSNGPLSENSICYGEYWIACQSTNNSGYGVWIMRNNLLEGYRYYDGRYFRPIVRLNSSVKFFDNGNNEYIISK